MHSLNLGISHFLAKQNFAFKKKLAIVRIVLLFKIRSIFYRNTICTIIIFNTANDESYSRIVEVWHRETNGIMTPG